MQPYLSTFLHLRKLPLWRSHLKQMQIFKMKLNETNTERERTNEQEERKSNLTQRKQNKTSIILICTCRQRCNEDREKSKHDELESAIHDIHMNEIFAVLPNGLLFIRVFFFRRFRFSFMNWNYRCYGIRSRYVAVWLKNETMETMRKKTNKWANECGVRLERDIWLKIKWYRR